MQLTRVNSQNDMAAEIPKELETCRFCKNQINDGASICHHCGRHQVIIMQYLRAEWVGILISVVMMVIAFREFHIARVERQEVEKALRDANAALKTALSVERKAGEMDKLHVKIRNLRREIKRLDEQLAKSDNQQNDHLN